MPAMPQEKAAAVSLEGNNFTQLKSTNVFSTVSVSVPITSPAMMPTHTSQTKSACRISNTLENRLTQHRKSCLDEDLLKDFNDTHRTNNMQQSTKLSSTPKLTTGTISSVLSSKISSSNEQHGSRISNHINTETNDNEEVNSDVVTVKSSTTMQPKKSPNDYIFGKYIGEGSFSTVYLAIDVNTKREYAIKVCEKRHILRENIQEYIHREREVMHMMSNVPGFVNLSCTFQDNRFLYFVMTYAKNGDLLPYINKVGSFDLDCSRHYAAELVLSCEQMHRRNIVHRDLKPENILMDEDMHTLIADFGSAKIISNEDQSIPLENVSNQFSTKNRKKNLSENDVVETCNDNGESSKRRQNIYRKRRGSFVGTAQYVSPEVLQNGSITPASDLWALGCIIYQMISGLPPFRGNYEYVIFKEVQACNVVFPHGFDKNAEDLVRKLLKLDPQERLGAKDVGVYTSIRSHPFFFGTDFEKIRQISPPPIYPYLPDAVVEENFPSKYQLAENLEPGLDDKQITRLLSVELGTAIDYSKENNVEKQIRNVKNCFDLTNEEKKKRFEQQKCDKWHIFAENEIILKKGYVNKRKGLFARRRMLLLTTGPRLIYIDPVQMIKKGEIPWTSDLRVEAKNFKIFFVHTPNRTYYLDDPEAYSLEWVNAILKVHELNFKDKEKETKLHITTSTASK